MKGWLTRPLTRRQFLERWLLIGTWGLGSLWTAKLAGNNFFDQLTVTEYSIKTPKWPLGHPPLTAAFLTDLHIGSMGVGLDKLDSLIAQTNALQADIILLGGDFLTALHPHKWTSYIKPGPIAKKLSALHAPLGVYSVLGNHDWYCDGENMRRQLEENGIKVLENDSVFVPFGLGGFWIVGLADYTMRRVDIDKAMRATNGSQPKIILSHDPYTYKDVLPEAVVQLSGHTHGGQVTLPFVGPIAVPTPNTPLRWSYGLIEEGPAPMIVSSGVGTSMVPFKNTPFEVVRVVISAA